MSAMFVLVIRHVLGVEYVVIVQEVGINHQSQYEMDRIQTIVVNCCKECFSNHIASLRLSKIGLENAQTLLCSSRM